MNIRTLSITIFTAVLLLFIQSCKPKNSQGQEGITTVYIKLTSLQFGTQVFTYKNVNETVTKDSLKLKAGEVYTCELELLDETQNPAEDLTEEVKAEATAHQFFFTPSPTSMLSITDLDKDKDGKVVGITSKWTAGSTQSGTLGITLKHLGDTPKTGNISDGETDVEILLDVIVQ